MKRVRNVIHLSAAEAEAFREAKHQDRLALADRVRRAELTAAEANEQASIFRGRYDPAKAVLDWNATFASLRRLNVHEGSQRNTKKTVRA